MARPEGITVNHSVPSVFRQWASVLSGTEDISSLRLIELGGEATTVGDVELYKRFLPASCVFVNGLASNETGTITRYMIDHSTPITGNSVPVGFAVPGKDLLLLDDDGNEVPAGEVGEIAVRSRFLSPGYWNRPDLTAATFLADSARPDERTYRTGDLGSFLPDGCLIHKGRKDFRAKIRGIRVETVEVEATLQSHPAVQVAAVAIHDQHKGGHTLTAHVVFKPASPITSVDDLRTFLSGTLPDYMVPAAFVFHKTDLPRLLNGKIDRRGLSEAARARPSRSTPFEAPRDAVEWDVANIWTAVLGVHSISIHDSFVDLGGDSLSAAAVAARIEKAFNRPLPVADLVRSPRSSSWRRFSVATIAASRGLLSSSCSLERENVSSSASPSTAGSRRSCSTSASWRRASARTTPSTPSSHAGRMAHPARMEASRKWLPTTSVRLRRSSLTALISCSAIVSAEQSLTRRHGNSAPKGRRSGPCACSTRRAAGHGSTHGWGLP